MQQVSESMKDHEWIWKKYIPRGCVTILAAKGGVGKSGLALYIASTIAKENKFKTLYVDYEQTTRHMSQRWRDWGYADVKDYVLIPVEKNNIGEYESVKPTFKEIRDIGLKNTIDLLIIDSMTSLYNRYDIESRRGGSALINELRELSVELNCGLLLLAHTNKAVNDISQISIDNITGSAAVVDMSRSVLFLTTDINNERLRTIHHIKHNYTERSPDATFELTSQGIVNFKELKSLSKVKLFSGTKSEMWTSIMREGLLNGLTTKKELRKYVIDRGATQMEATRAYKSLENIINV